MEFQVVDKTKWEELTPQTPSKPADKYAPLLDALEADEIVQVETKDDKEAKGLRISIARKASGRGFRVEYRTDGNTLYVKKSEQEVTPSKPKKKKVTQPA